MYSSQITALNYFLFFINFHFWWLGHRSHDEDAIGSTAGCPFYVTTLRKLYTHLCLCHQTVVWYLPHGSEALRLIS